MTALGHSRRFGDVRIMSVHPPIAAAKRTWRHFSFVPTAVISAPVRNVDDVLGPMPVKGSSDSSIVHFVAATNLGDRFCRSTAFTQNAAALATR
jgi:hypothetical protein